ncbi:MAG TPA: HDIG domain-containing protein [Bacteroidia bacterium]|nr:HDIG domain-containing protein [Bacteroidia bacterium]
MRKLLIYISNQHETILRLIIISLTVFIIINLLPHRVRYKFEFHKGTAWLDKDLSAPFDFAINKEKDTVEAEKKDIVKTAPLFFNTDTSIHSKTLEKFRSSLSSDVTVLDSSQIKISDIALSEQFKQTGEKILNIIYAKGIIESEPKINVNENTKLRLVKGKVAETAYGKDVFTMSSAAAFVDELLKQFSPGDKEKLKKQLTGALRPDLFYDISATEAFRKQLTDNVSLTRGMVSKGDIIISRGEVISDDKFNVLQSLRQSVEENKQGTESDLSVFLGQLAIVCIAISVLMIFLATLRKDVFSDNKKITLICVLIILITLIYTQALRLNFISLYLVPCCLLPIVIRVFFDTRLALFTHVLTILILGSVAPNGFEFVFMQTIAGMITIFIFAHLRKRAQLFISVSMIFISYLICYLALSIVQEGSFAEINYINIGWLFGNVLLTLFAYPLIYMFEKLFGLTSDVSLMELSDMNSTLLRELSLKAPGTFQHSMQVANLAEAAVYKVGGNTLLVRVGALYHDIGKMDMPLYFIENQSTDVNPHDDLSFEESADIIISHVIRGIEKARKNNLPDLIIDFIRTHHGTTMVQYFYQSYLKNYPEKIVDEDDFRYPGPLPFSIETAVLMMADSVEAASRSLQKHEAETINKLVEDIIESQIHQQQFINCDITFKDISSIKKIFKKMLMSIYHVRVEYPH